MVIAIRGPGRYAELTLPLLSKLRNSERESIFSSNSPARQNHLQNISQFHVITFISASQLVKDNSLFS